MLRRAWKRRLAGARRACCNRSVLRARADLEPDIASAAALIGDPSRAAILAALADGRTLPAGELARVAGISPQTASSHLDRLFKAVVVAELENAVLVLRRECFEFALRFHRSCGRNE